MVIENEIWLGKSKINQYNMCPYSYKLSYIDKIKPKEIPKALSRGIEIHEMLEFFFKLSGNIKFREKIFKESHLYKKYESIGNNFLKWYRKINENKSCIVEPLSTEMTFINKNILCKGTVDAVFKDGDDVLLLDYKSGKYRGLSHHRFELALYAYLFMEETGIEITHWGIFFVEQDRFCIEEVVPEEIIKAVSNVYKTRANIKKDLLNNNFRKKPSFMCNWCMWKMNGYCEGNK